MTTFAANVKVNSKLTEIERGFAIPLVEVATMLVPNMGTRIKQGVAPTGYFSAYGAHGVPSPGGGLFWVAPTSPQPPGFLARSKAGWAGYRSYDAYLEARGLLGQPRTFTESGEAWNNLRIRVNGPARVKVAFYGAHKHIPPPLDDNGRPVYQRRKGTRAHRDGKRYQNSEVMYLASVNEREPLLTPSRGELQQVAALFQSEVMAGALANAADAQQVRGLGQRLTRLQKRLPASALGSR